LLTAGVIMIFKFPSLHMLREVFYLSSVESYN